MAAPEARCGSVALAALGAGRAAGLLTSAAVILTVAAIILTVAAILLTGSLEVASNLLAGAALLAYRQELAGVAAIGLGVAASPPPLLSV